MSPPPPKVNDVVLVECYPDPLRCIVREVVGSTVRVDVLPDHPGQQVHGLDDIPYGFDEVRVLPS